MKRSGKHIKKIKKKPQQITVQIDDELIEKKQKHLEIFIIAVLLAFSIYLSILYFGHQQVPNSDFPAFFKTGKEILTFNRPGSFKRGPVVGMLQFAVSRFFSGPNAGLTAGWLLNAALYPLIALLFYLLGRKLLGPSAVWFTILAVINPWHLSMLRHPIAEIILIFFMVLSAYLILKRSRWRYFVVVIATLVRYDAAVLIAVAFLMDMIESRCWKDRIKALLASVVATIPVFLWMLGLRLTQKSASGVSSMHYVRNYGGKTVVGQFAQQLWQVSVAHLFRATTPPSFQTVSSISKILLVVCLIIALVYIIYKKHYKASIILALFSLTFLGQAFRNVTQARYAIPIAWMTLFLCFYGLTGLWRLITNSKFQDDLETHFSNTGSRLPKPLIIALQIILMVAAAIWFCAIIPLLPKIADFSKQSFSVPYVAMALVAVIVIARIYVYKTRFLTANLTITAVMFLMIVSNQYAITQVLGNGDNDAEFKKLAQWYRQNAQPGDKLVTTLPHVASLFVEPEQKKCFISTGRVTAGSPQDFVKRCYRKNITYITWDSRIGFTPNNKYYRQWGIKNIGALAQGRSVGPFQFIEQIKLNDRRYINIFRLREISPEQRKELLKIEN
jgi:hypothetical protein